MPVHTDASENITIATDQPCLYFRRAASGLVG